MISVARGRRVPRVIPVAIGLAWAVILTAQAMGRAGLVDHDRILAHGHASWAGVGLFILAWQLMVAAMMLPSSLPMVRLYWATGRSQPRAGAALSAFLGGYAAVWSAFAVAALAGDALLHRTVDAWAWLDGHAYVIGGGVLLLAGAFEFSALKDRCLQECRHPGAFLLQHYRRGGRGGFALGLRHGAFCLGCCWALMLLMFAVGVSSLLWMAGLGAVMLYEKVGPRGTGFARIVGASLLLWGGLVLLQPGWLPAFAAGVG